MRARRAAAAGLFAALAAAGCDRLVTSFGGGAGPEAGLLRGKQPVSSHGVTHVTRLTDGIAAEAGDPPSTDLTAELRRADSFVVWDLGAETPVRCALIDADGDDTYTLSVSKDGKDFVALYATAPDEDRGQQLRAGRDLKGSGRYLRLSAAGGDGLWSVSEVRAWSDCPATWPALAVQKGTPDDEAVRLKLWAFVALGVAYVLAYRKRAPDWVKLLGVAPAGIGAALAVQVAELWPPSAALAMRLAAAVAIIAAAAVARRLRDRKRPPPPA